jgi:glycosyltransferase involved in cell wall biosynthesis
MCKYISLRLRLRRSSNSDGAVSGSEKVSFVRPLIVCSKSTWEPAIRREHALSEQAAMHGHAVVFLERPLDVRAMRDPTQRRRWLRAAVPRRCVARLATVTVVRTAALAPGHRGAIAQRAESRRLLAQLRRIDGLSAATVVATQPWQWPAVSACGARRIVFDCADDWSALLPRRRQALEALQRRIGSEAEAVIAVTDDLESRFQTTLTVVPNGTGSELLSRAVVDLPRHARKLVYVGTLSERFDAELVRRLMELLPDWSLDLHGPCQYAGIGTEPAPELIQLIAARGSRVRWCGVVERSLLACAIDAGTVAIIPHRLGHTFGQDSMKLYDYAARGRPIVSSVPPSSPIPSGILIANDASQFADAVQAAAQLPQAILGGLRAWAELQTWPARWALWHRAVLGEDS